MLSAFFSCYLWWLLAGALLGWLAHWWLCKCTVRDQSKTHTSHTAPTSNTSNSASTGMQPAGFASKASAGMTSLAGAGVGAVGALGAMGASAAASASAAVSKVAADPVIDVAAAKAAGILVKGAGDLEVIEGIGPKICGLFHAAGHKTFMQVSNMSVQQMSKILDDAGPRFKLANPETWAQQAKLAAHNQWAQLKSLQDTLTAGVDLSQDRVQQDRSEL